jgi:hypothetical protein
MTGTDYYSGAPDLHGRVIVILLRLTGRASRKSPEALPGTGHWIRNSHQSGLWYEIRRDTSLRFRPRKVCGVKSYVPAPAARGPRLSAATCGRVWRPGELVVKVPGLVILKDGQRDDVQHGRWPQAGGDSQIPLRLGLRREPRHHGRDDCSRAVGCTALRPQLYAL